MKVRIQDGLPYITASLQYNGNQLTFENVLLDTGSAGAIFSTDRLLALGMQYEPEDNVKTIRGVGGVELVFTKCIDSLSVDELQVEGFEIEVGIMDYGFDIDGIIGMDFLVSVGAIIDLDKLEIRSAKGQ